MNEIGLNHFLMLGALLFVCGAVCMAIKRNAIGILMGVELVLNGANINFVGAGPLQSDFQPRGADFRSVRDRPCRRRGRRRAGYRPELLQQSRDR
jgi:hypothetical protein